MGQLLGFKNVVFPAQDLATSVDAWTAVLGQEPAFVGEDFAAFTGAGAEVGLSSAPWVDHPLVFWEVEEIGRRTERSLRPARSRWARSPTAR
jgi:hypothetical protein